MKKLIFQNTAFSGSILSISLNLDIAPNQADQFQLFVSSIGLIQTRIDLKFIRKI